MERVSLLKCAAYDADLKATLEKLLQPLGGVRAFCKPGDRVLLKPNLIAARTVDSAATTHPKLIIAVAELINDYGGKVGVGDSPGIGTAESVLRKLGLDADLQRLNVPIVEFNTPVALAGKGLELGFERRFKHLYLARELDEFDQLINLPKLKSHGQMGITLATKNLFGCVVGHNKGRWHFAAGKDLEVFARLLVEIALTAKPGLHILDGIIGMDGNGPSHGRPRQFAVLAASANPLALDRVVIELVQRKPEQFPIAAAAQKLAVPGARLSEVELVGPPLNSLKIADFQIPSLLRTNIFVNETFSQIASHILKQRLVLNPQLCIGCRKCEEFCPAQAISYNQRISIDDNTCIRCCCCQELCPVGALRVSEPLAVKILRRLGLM